MSTAAITLREWEVLRPESGTALAGRSLSDNRSRRLAEQLAEYGSIEVLELARGLEVRATSFVGRLNFGDITITIQPKLSGAPFINLLRYAYGFRNLNLYKAAEYATKEWAFQDLLIRQLAAEVTELLLRGMHRNYERAHADLANPRGRIDFDRVAKMTYQTTARLPCIHHPRTEDTLLNQVVLAGLVHASRITVDNDLRAHVRRLSKILAETVSSKYLSADVVANAMESIDRRSPAYLPILRIIDLLLKARGASLESDRDSVILPGFLFDMNRFFQALISRFLHDYLDGYQIQDEYRLKELFCYDPNLNPKRRNAPVQKPDFVIRCNHKIAAIVDAKYRDLWEKPLPREMLYQLALYALGQSENQRKAVILYPTLASSASDQAIQLRDPSSGDFQALVILRPVNLIELESLLRNSDWNSHRQKERLAMKLSFGKGIQHCISRF